MKLEMSVRMILTSWLRIEPGGVSSLRPYASPRVPQELMCQHQISGAGIESFDMAYIEVPLVENLNVWVGISKVSWQEVRY